MTVAETLVAGRYRIGPCLGTGGMGRVWLARDEVLRRDVAIKEIALPFGLTDEEREEMRARTLREARAAARLSHPNVVRIYDVQHGDERPWIVMEYVPSRSLLQVIKENGPLPPKDVAGIGLAVLAALDAADRVGVVHRDVKPSNVLIADDGRVLLTDFGAAMIDEGEGALTQTGVILGSPRYIAPERAATGISTLESDLWSLGATLYEAVEGRGPYTRETTLAVLVALATEKPDPLDHAGPLKPVINGLLQKNPKNRMRPLEVEQRLRRIADVQNAVRLHQVPMPRFGEVGAAARPSVPDSPDDDSMPDGVVVRLDSIAIPAAAAGAASATSPAGPAAASVPTQTGSPQSGAAQRDAAQTGAPQAGPFPAGAPQAGPFPAGAAQSGPPQSGAAQAGAAQAGSARSGGIWAGSAQAGSAQAGSARLGTAPGSSSALSPAPARLPTRSTPVVPRRRRRAGLLAAGAATAVVLTGAGVYLVAAGSPWSEDDPVITAEAATTAAPSSAPAARPAAPAPAVPSATLPAGFSWYTSKSGFRVAWPAKWVKIDESRTSVILCNPGGPPVVAVRQWTPSDPDLTAALRREETAAGLRNYKRVRMDVAPQQTSAEWEYTFTDPKMGALHGVERVVVQNGRTYLLQWRTPAADWDKHRAAMAVIVNTFRPAAPSSAAARAVPAGFIAYRSASGFRTLAPAKWGKVEEDRTHVVFCAPGGPPLVGVRAWTPSNVDLAVAMAREEESADLPQYRRISMETLPGQLGAIWEYTFTDPKMGQLRGVDRAFVTPTGAFIVQWRTPVDEWTENLPKLGVVTNNFRSAA